MDANRISTGPPPAALRLPDAGNPAPAASAQPQRGRVPAARVAPEVVPAEGGRQAMLLARVQAAPASPQDKQLGRLGALLVAGMLAPEAARSLMAATRPPGRERVSAQSLAPPLTPAPGGKSPAGTEGSASKLHGD